MGKRTISIHHRDGSVTKVFNTPAAREAIASGRKRLLRVSTVDQARQDRYEQKAKLPDPPPSTGFEAFKLKLKLAWLVLKRAYLRGKYRDCVEASAQYMKPVGRLRAPLWAWMKRRYHRMAVNAYYDEAKVNTEILVLRKQLNK